MNHNILSEVLVSSKQWVKHFNNGDADYCVSAYLPDAIMEVKSMGTFEGTDNIDGFWRPFIQSGAKDLKYQDIWLKQIDETKVHLGANWSMSAGRGTIILEEWVKTESGVWKLSAGQFEIKEQY